MYADSGIQWIDLIYDWCVILLINAADQLGITYEEINVWLFVIVIPLVLIFLVITNFILFLKLRAYKYQNIDCA